MLTIESMEWELDVVILFVVARCPNDILDFKECWREECELWNFRVTLWIVENEAYLLCLHL